MRSERRGYVFEAITVYLDLKQVCAIVSTTLDEGFDLLLSSGDAIHVKLEPSSQDDVDAWEQLYDDWERASS